MPRDFPERDWKHLRALHAQALGRFCEQTLAQAQTTIADPVGSPHERYLALCRLLRERDQQRSQLFDDLRRSTAWVRLLGLVTAKWVSQEELAGFSEETRAFLARL